MKKTISYLFCAILILSFSVPSFSVQPEEKVIVLDFEGEVTVLLPDDRGKVECRRGLLLPEGTEIVTREKAFVDITFYGNRQNKVRIQPDSKVILKLHQNEKIELVDGEAFFLIKNLEGKSSFEVKTPAAVCGARGTGWLLSVSGQKTLGVVFEGSVYFVVKQKGQEKRYSVETGWRIVVPEGEEQILLERMDPAVFDVYLKEFMDVMYRRTFIDKKIELINNYDNIRERRTDNLRRPKDEIDKKNIIDRRPSGKYKKISP